MYALARSVSIAIFSAGAVLGAVVSGSAIASADPYQPGADDGPYFSDEQDVVGSVIIRGREFFDGRDLHKD